jgi:hypothetical protein
MNMRVVVMCEALRVTNFDTNSGWTPELVWYGKWNKSLAGNRNQAIQPAIVCYSNILCIGRLTEVLMKIKQNYKGISHLERKN